MWKWYWDWRESTSPLDLYDALCKLVHFEIGNTGTAQNKIKIYVEFDYRRLLSFILLSQFLYCTIFDLLYLYLLLSLKLFLFIFEQENPFPYKVEMILSDFLLKNLFNGRDCKRRTYYTSAFDFWRYIFIKTKKKVPMHMHCCSHFLSTKLIYLHE